MQGRGRLPESREGKAKVTNTVVRMNKCDDMLTIDSVSGLQSEHRIYAALRHRGQAGPSALAWQLDSADRRFALRARAPSRSSASGHVQTEGLFR